MRRVLSTCQCNNYDGWITIHCEFQREKYFMVNENNYSVCIYSVATHVNKDINTIYDILDKELTKKYYQATKFDKI